MGKFPELLNSVVLLRNLGTVVALNPEHYSDTQIEVFDLRESDGCIEVVVKGQPDRQIRFETPGESILMPSAVFIDNEPVKSFHPWVTDPLFLEANAILERVANESLQRSREHLRQLLCEEEWEAIDEERNEPKLTRREAIRQLGPILARHLT